MWAAWADTNEKSERKIGIGNKTKTRAIAEDKNEE